MTPLRRLVLGASVTALAVAGGWFVLGRLAAVSQEKREQIVELVRAGQITEEDEFGNLILPDEFADAAVHGEVQVRTDPFTVFFLTETFFGPDPYCGYEYTEGQEPMDDPLGSGDNRALESLGDGWWYLCAS